MRLSISACTTAAFSVVPLHQAERMFVAVGVAPEGRDQHQVVVDMQAVDLDRHKVERPSDVRDGAAAFVASIACRIAGKNCEPASSTVCVVRHGAAGYKLMR
jgi:hypothetical protein